LYSTSSGARHPAANAKCPAQKQLLAIDYSWPKADGLRARADEQLSLHRRRSSRWTWRFGAESPDLGSSQAPESFWTV